MTIAIFHHPAESDSPPGQGLKATHLSADKAELRALLIEGAISPKTTRLDNNYIEILRRQSRAKMGL
jgi:hypothetical protein